MLARAQASASWLEEGGLGCGAAPGGVQQTECPKQDYYWEVPV